MLRGVPKSAGFTNFLGSIAAMADELEPREAAFEGAMKSYPGADHQNLYRFVEAEY